MMLCPIAFVVGMDVSGVARPGFAQEHRPAFTADDFPGEVVVLLAAVGEVLVLPLCPSLLAEVEELLGDQGRDGVLVPRPVAFEDPDVSL